MHFLREELEHFLFDPLEGLEEIERFLMNQRAAIPWLRRATTPDRREGWLRRGLFLASEPLWVKPFFDTLLSLYDDSPDETFRRDLLAKMAELAAALPSRPWTGSLFYSFVTRIERLQKEMERAWAIQGIVQAAASLGVTEWSRGLFQELLRLARLLRFEKETALVLLQITEALASFGTHEWAGRLLEEVIESIRRFQDETLRLETIYAVSELFLGYERLRPEIATVPWLKHLAFLGLIVGATNHPRFRPAFARRIHFVLHQMPGTYEIVTDTWERLFTCADDLEPWTYEERDLHQGLRWQLHPVSALLRLLARDFARVKNRAWAQKFFYLLLDRIPQLPPGREREEVLRDLIHGILCSPLGEADAEAEAMAWVQHALDRSKAIDGDLSSIYEGLALGFLERGMLNKASETIRRITQLADRDRAYARLIRAWLAYQQPQQALLALYEITQPDKRAEMAAWLSLQSPVARDPIAASLLCQQAASLPSVSLAILRNLATHPELPPMALAPLLSASSDENPTHWARRERLLQLQRLRPYLPPLTFLSERRYLLGLTSLDPLHSPPSKEIPEMSFLIMLEKPHAYGDKHYLTPREHITKNHFGQSVAGSRFTIWQDFDQMWTEIQERVALEVKPEEGVQVIELTFPIDIGMTGVTALEDAILGKMAIEERNGQPSLYCLAPEARQPTRSMTIVIGPSHLEPDAIPGYPGHKEPYALYTVYPGKPSYPFPRCQTEDHEKLRASLRASLSLLQAGQREEAKAVLYEAYRSLGAGDDAARYWSNHVLIR